MTIEGQRDEKPHEARNTRRVAVKSNVGSNQHEVSAEQQIEDARRNLRQAEKNLDAARRSRDVAAIKRCRSQVQLLTESIEDLEVAVEEEIEVARKEAEAERARRLRLALKDLDGAALAFAQCGAEISAAVDALQSRVAEATAAMNAAASAVMPLRSDGKIGVRPDLVAFRDSVVRRLANHKLATENRHFSIGFDCEQEARTAASRVLAWAREGSE